MQLPFPRPLPTTDHMFVWRDVVLMAWHGESAFAPERLARTWSALGEFTSGQRGKLSLFHLAQPSVPILNDEARRLFTRIGRQYDRRLASVGVLLLGSGFWASVMQSASTSMQRLAAGSFKVVLGTRLDKLAPQFAQVHHRQGGAPMESEDLSAVVLTVLRVSASQQSLRQVANLGKVEQH